MVTTPTTIIPKKLAQAAITGSMVTIYTVPASTTTEVQAIDIVNTTAAPITVRVCFVPNAGAAGTENAIFWDSQIAPNGNIAWGGPQALDVAGDFIAVQASAVGCTITISGLEISA